MNTQANIESQCEEPAMNKVESQEQNGVARVKPSKRFISRRSFLGKSIAVGAGTMGAGLLANALAAKGGNAKGSNSKGSPGLTRGDADILRFLAAAEIIETDLCQQYNELAGIQHS